MMNLLIDYISPQGTRAMTTRLDKIACNITAIEVLANAIAKQKETTKNTFSSITVFGRWIVIYQANGSNDNDTIMHFIDFKIDMSGVEELEIFSQKTLNNIIKLQHQYDAVFKPKHDTIELSYAEPFEKVVKANLFACGDNDIVLKKAKSLGALPAIEGLHNNDRVKVVIVDEVLKADDGNITNLYAILHFGGSEEPDDNGFAYLKIHDLYTNYFLLDDFGKAITDAGGRFERSYLIEKFNIQKLN